jgi:hypothetical protein
MSTAIFALLQAPVAMPGVPGQILTPTFVQVLAKTPPAGSWEVFVDVNLTVGNTVNFGSNTVSGDAYCNLMSNNTVIGAATNRTNIPPGELAKRTFTIFGGAIVPTGGGEVSLWCASQFGSAEFAESAAIMAVSLGQIN